MARSRTLPLLAPVDPIGEPDSERAVERETDALEVERKLVARARRGDAEAWARLYQDHFDTLLRHVTYLLGDVSAAEDVVQESFARALASLSRFRGTAAFATWLQGIALNLVRMRWRSRTRRARAYERLASVQFDAFHGSANEPDEAVVHRRRGQVLLAVLDTLPTNLREAYVFCDLVQTSPTDAARQLGISRGNLRVRASRARARIRRELIKLGWIDPREDGS